MSEKSLVGARIGWPALIAMVALTAAAAYFTQTGAAPQRPTLERAITGLMGTEAHIVVTLDKGAPQTAAAEALALAEQRMRNIEARLSSWLNDSEISRLNRAQADETVALSDDALAVLREAIAAHALTDGAFDIGCRPLIELWKTAGKSGEAPSEKSIKRAMAASSISAIRLVESGALKTAASAQVDLGGIAKGYAIDQAALMLKSQPFVAGGIVEIGGDLRCFGLPPRGADWKIDIRQPNGEPEALSSLKLANAAVCTSGDYARYVIIDGERHSHIVDPRTGRPASVSPSVTVIASLAVTADIWATALSVLGEAGLEKLPDGVEAAIALPGPNQTLTLKRTMRFPSE